MDNQAYQPNTSTDNAPNYSDPSQTTKEQAAHGQPPAYYPPNQPANPGYPVQQQYGYSQPMNYGQYTTVATNVIGVQPIAIPPDAVIVAQTHVVFQPPNYLCLSCCTFWFINFLFGIIAFIFSVMSNSAFGEGKIEQARSHGKVALSLNVAGMITSAILITVLIIVLA